jgi:hypothetical protein
MRCRLVVIFPRVSSEDSHSLSSNGCFVSRDALTLTNKIEGRDESFNRFVHASFLKVCTTDSERKTAHQASDSTSLGRMN